MVRSSFLNSTIKIANGRDICVCTSRDLSYSVGTRYNNKIYSYIGKYT